MLHLVILFILSLSNLPLSLLFTAAAMMGFPFVLLQVPLPIFIKGIFGEKQFAHLLGIAHMCITIGIGVTVPLSNLIFDITGSYRPAFFILMPVVVVALILLIIATRSIKKGGLQAVINQEAK